MCLVETGVRDAKTGKVAMQPKLVPACNIPVADGLVLSTNSEKVKQARATVEEGLLLRHPIDCPICDKAGECVLQDYHFQHGQDSRRADLDPFTSRRRNLGDVQLFVDRCILCSRCVRFTAEVSGTRELMVVGRGAGEEIDVLPGFPLHNNLSGNVVDLCPVGALADKDFLYQQRVWFLRRRASVCTGCAAGCSIWVEENQDRIYRLKPRENPLVNKWWICNDGRYGYHHVHDPRRLAAPRLREDGKVAALDGAGLAGQLMERLRKAGRLAGVISPFLTVEEAYLLCKLLRSIDPQATLVLGPAPTAGVEERYPGGFVVAAEKCPNRRGVEEVVAHFARRVDPLERLVSGVGPGRIGRRLGLRRLQDGVDRRGDGRPLSTLAAVDRSRPLPLAAFRTCRIRVARGGLRRKGRLLCEPMRPPANGRLGDSSAPGRSARGRVALGDARRAEGCIAPGACWTKRHGKSSISPPPSDRSPMRGST